MRRREKKKEKERKRKREHFSFLLLCLSPLVSFKIKNHLQRCDKWGYLMMGIAMAAPCVVLPPLYPGEADKLLPLRKRFWVKATVWISIFSHIGNYFWTHYFFELLGAEYTFKAHRMNGVRGRIREERRRKKREKLD